MTAPDVALGIRHVEAGDYDAAILVLDTAARRLAKQTAPSRVLARAYLYLGVAYLAKGHETSAKARFRDALAQAHDLEVSPDSFPPRVVEMFEEARVEMRTASAKAEPKKSGGPSTLLLAGGGLALAAAGVAVAASMHPDTSCCAPPPGEQFQNEIIHAGTVRDFVITSNGTGTLNARLSWVPARVVLGMHIAALSDAQQVLAEGIESGSSERSLSLPVTARAYRISVTHNSGQGAQGRLVHAPRRASLRRPRRRSSSRWPASGGACDRPRPWHRRRETRGRAGRRRVDSAPNAALRQRATHGSIAACLRSPTSRMEWTTHPRHAADDSVLGLPERHL